MRNYYHLKVRVIKKNGDILTNWIRVNTLKDLKLVKNNIKTTGFDQKEKWHESVRKLIDLNHVEVTNRY